MVRWTLEPRLIQMSVWSPKLFRKSLAMILLSSCCFTHHLLFKGNSTKQVFFCLGWRSKSHHLLPRQNQQNLQEKRHGKSFPPKLSTPKGWICLLFVALDLFKPSPKNKWFSVFFEGNEIHHVWRFPSLSSNFVETHCCCFWCQSQQNLQKENKQELWPHEGNLLKSLDDLLPFICTKNHWMLILKMVLKFEIQQCWRFPLVLSKLRSVQNSRLQDGCQNGSKKSWETMVDGITTSHSKRKTHIQRFLSFWRLFGRTFTDACEQDSFNVTLQYGFPALSLSLLPSICDATVKGPSHLPWRSRSARRHGVLSRCESSQVLKGKRM